MSILLRKNMHGSFTVEAAIVLPMVLLCIFWMLEKGIVLYTETIQCISNQQIWEEFHPAEEFRKLELLRELI